jgi:succinyl-CoA synthetase beta subunit
MAQVGIREFDAKKMCYEFMWEKYTWIQIQNLDDISYLSPEKKYAIKPDMLFWKRWKRWLLWLNLDKKSIKSWLGNHYNSTVNIDWVNWELDVFLAEEFYSLQDEYYISFSQNRDWDTLSFSTEWWIDIEENWGKTISITLSPLGELENKDLEFLWITDSKIKNIIWELWSFYRSYWFVYLEINPLWINEKWKFIIVDMVAKMDDSEGFRQKEHWKNLKIPQSFGYKENKRERYIRELDSQTWASMKFKVLNKDAKIWTLLAGWWGSLVITDTLWHLWYADQIWNYW